LNSLQATASISRGGGPDPREILFSVLGATVILRVIPLVGILAALAVPVRLAAQNAGRPTAPKLEVLVDGSKHPELVPDRVAASAMLSSLVINDGSFTPLQELKIKNMGFNALDGARFRSELFLLRDRLKDHETERTRGVRPGAAGEHR
jgi:hypothetical protein